MYYFYPLPVTPNYMRFKKKKTAERISVEKLEDTAVVETAPLFESEDKKYSIWTVSSWRNQNYYRTKEENAIANLLSQQEISIFDCSDSKVQYSTLKSFFDLHLPEKNLEERKTSLAIETKMFDCDLTSVLLSYRQLGTFHEQFTDEMLGDDEFRTVIFEDIFAHKQEIFFTSKIDNVLNKKEYQICSDSRWLHLMSWWKSLNQNLNSFSEDLDQIVQQQRRQTEANESESKVELIGKIDILLRKLKTVHDSPEVVALESIVCMKRTKLAADWPLSWGQGRFFIDNLNQDYKRMIFVKECSNHTIRLLFSVMEVLQTHFKDKGVMNKVELVLSESFEDLYFSLHTLDDRMVFRDFVANLTKTTKEKINSLVDQICKYRSKKILPTPISLNLLVIELLYEIIEAIEKCRRFRAHNGRDIFDLISNQVFEILKYGIILSELTFQKTFLTEELLLKISKQEPDFPTNIFTVSCARMAYSFVVVHKMVCRTKEYHLLPHNYSRHDFSLFLTSLNKNSNILTPEIDDISFQYFLRIRTISDHLIREFSEKMENISSSINRMKVLLYQCRYAEKTEL